MIQGERAVRDLDHVGLSVGQPKLARSIGQPHRHLESLRLFDSGGSRLTRILRYTATSSCKPSISAGCPRLQPPGLDLFDPYAVLY